MATVGRRLLSSIVQSGDTHTYLSLALEPYLFRDSEVELYEAINNHIIKYGKIPSPTTLEGMGFTEDLAEAPEPPKFYLDEVEKRYLRSTLKTMVIEANESLVNEDETAAYDNVMKTLSTIHLKRNRKTLFDFRHSHELLWSEYVKQNVHGSDYTLSFGWPYLDELSGGMRGGDFIVFVGRPASGKTFKLLYMAYNSWKSKRVPLVVSMEMNTLIMAQRLGAMHTHTNLTHVMKAKLSDTAVEKYQEGLIQAGNNDTPLWIVDGNLTATVDDIVMLCRQLGVTDVYVDGAYLLQHPNKKLSKWDKMAENAEMLKQKVAQDLNIPVVASYQFSKESKKKKGKDDKVSMEDIYGSDSIAQLASIILGLLEVENIETQISRVITVLKGRSGETGEFRVKWDFLKMDFSQIDDKKKSGETPDAPQAGYEDLEFAK